MTTGGEALFVLQTDNSAFEAGLQQAEQVAQSSSAAIANALGGLVSPLGAATDGVGRLLNSLRGLAYLELAIPRLAGQFEDLGRAILGPASAAETFMAQMAALQAGQGNLAGATAEATNRLQELKNLASTEGAFDLHELETADINLQRTGGDVLASVDHLKDLAAASFATGSSLESTAGQVGYLYALLQGGEPIGRAVQALQKANIITSDARDRLTEMEKAGASQNDMLNVLWASIGRYNTGLDQANQTMSGFAGLVKNNIQNALVDFGQALDSQLRPSIQGMAADLKGINLEGLGAAFGNLFGAQLQGAVQTIAQALPNIFNYFVQLGTEIGQLDWSGLGQVASIVGNLIALMGPLVEGFVLWLNTLTEVIGAVAQMSGVVPVLQAVGDALSQHKEIVSALIGIWASFKIADLVAALGGLATGLLGIGTASAASSAELEAAVGPIQEAMQNLMLNFSSSFPAAVKTGLAAAAAAMDAGVEALTTAFTSIASKLWLGILLRLREK